MGLASGATVILQNNGADDLSVSANAAFTFATKIANDGTYAVTVLSQPTGQTCVVSNSQGIVTANVTNVAIACTSNLTQTFSIGGTVSGLAQGTTLVLQDNGNDTLTVSASGTFTFREKVATGAAYSVSVLTQPTSQSCSVTKGSGSVGSAAVTNIQVTCTAGIYSISGTVRPPSSSAGSIVTLRGAANAITTVNGVGNYSFQGLASGEYTVTPSGPATTFTPTSLPLTLGNSDVGSVDFAATSNVIFFDDFTGSSLGTAWTVISRHGEYAQNENECNVPQQVSVANSLLSIVTAVGPFTCGDFNIDGTVRHAPASWPYITGDLQWRSLNFKYGTVTVRAKFPSRATGLWPAIWLLGSNCQNTNPFTADIGYSSCPDFGSAYSEIDMVECDLNNWCQLAMWTGGNFPTCGFNIDPLDSNWHVFSLTWTAAAVTETIDGIDGGCTYTVTGTVSIPSSPMFLLIQTQTGGVGGTPNDALLPASLQIDFVKVTQP